MEKQTIEPKVSIIVPVYNGEMWIDRCMKSLLAQTLEDIEIWLINNGSNDTSQEIIDYYVVEYPGKVYSYAFDKNQRPAGARNKGIELATGEYIAFMDVDDTMEPDMYEMLYIRASRTNSDVTICAYTEFDMFQSPPKRISRYCRDFNDPLIWADASSIYENPMTLHLVTASIWNRIMRRDYVLKHNLCFKKVNSEDIYFAYTTVLYAKTISFLNYPLYHYYVYPNSAMFQKGESYGPEYTRLCGMLYDEYVKKTGPDSHQISILFVQLWYSIHRRRIMEMAYIDDKKRHRDIIDSVFDVYPKYIAHWRKWLIKHTCHSTAHKIWTRLITRRRTMLIYIALPTGLRKNLDTFLRGMLRFFRLLSI